MILKKHSFTIVFIAISSNFYSCQNHSLLKTLTIVNKDGSYFKGEVIKDSVFNGIVKYFDKSEIFLGFSTFKYGLQNGPSVKYFQSGNKSDSINYKNGFTSVLLN